MVGSLLMVFNVVLIIMSSMLFFFAKYWSMNKGCDLADSYIYRIKTLLLKVNLKCLKDTLLSFCI